MPPQVFHNPPIFSAIAVVTFFAVVTGIMFKDALEYQVGRWQANRLTQPTVEYQRPYVVLLYLSLCVWVALFLGTCLTVFGFSLWFALVVGAILSLMVGGLMWWQLGQVLAVLVQEGSVAFELDFPLGEPTDSAPESEE
ncbi:MAG: hypothetical protein OHK0012_10710 [Synechococcales cyanobacterium]